MASKRHDFIVSAIGRKIRQYGFKIIYLDGKFQDLDTKKFDIPPKIINHKPDIIGERDGIHFCVGEAKTKNDIFSKRTKNQFFDFFTIVKSGRENILLIGIPFEAKSDLEKLLLEIGLDNKKQIKILCVPEDLLPDEEEI